MPPARDDVRAPLPGFFIVGAHRSGTTMLRLMMNSHPNIAVPFETDFIPALHGRASEYGDLREPGRLALLLEELAGNDWVRRAKLPTEVARIAAYGPASVAEVVAAMLSEYARERGKTRWGEKTPDYVLDMDVLWAMFPGTRFVHLVRDGRDVALSLRGLSWGSAHLPAVASRWRRMTTLGHKMGAMIPEHYLEVRYEDLVLRTEEVLGRICAFIGEPFEQQMLDYAGSARGEMPRDSVQWHRSSVSAPDPAKVYQWKERLSRSDQIIFEEIAGDALDLFGYERVAGDGGTLVRLKRLYYGTLRRW